MRVKLKPTNEQEEIQIGARSLHQCFPAFTEH